MKLILSDVDYVIDTSSEKINTVVIENQNLMFSVLTDLNCQLLGLNGKSVLSDENKLLPIKGNLEIIDRFVPFNMNEKTLLNKISSDIENLALSESYFDDTISILGQLDTFFANLTYDYPCNIQFKKMNIGTFIKAAGIEIYDDYDTLGEKLIDYFQLVYELLGKKLFITINLRSLISDKDMELLLESIILHGFDVVMLENCEHNKLFNEKRVIVDDDLCLIS